MQAHAATSRGVVGIIGAGKSGTAIARLALKAGYTVRIASSGPVRDSEMIMRFVAPGVTTTTVAEVGNDADIVIVAVPLRRFRDIPASVLNGHVVVDVMNYWPPIDGVLPEFEDTGRASSTVVRSALPDSSTLVKTFNHLGYHQMEDLAKPTGHPDRIALGVSGDDPEAVSTVMTFVDAVGFDPVDAGRLEDSQPLQPETLIFGAALDRDTLTGLLARRTQRA